MNYGEWNPWIDGSLLPFLSLLGTWSLRWAVLILVLIVCIACQLLRNAATRSAAARIVLLAGLMLPLVPLFWGPVFSAARFPESVDVRDVNRAATDSPRSEVVSPRSGRIGQIIPDEVSMEPDRIIERPTPHQSDVNTTPAFQSPPKPLGLVRLTILIIAVVWVAEVLLQMVRLTAGWWWLTWLCRTAVSVRVHSESELSRCRSQLRISRQVRLKVQQLVEAPILVGGWQPWILVPLGWEKLSPTSRRTILLHELAHVRRYDDFAKLFEEVVRAIFFFHPLVQWLLFRIGAEREELCDQIVLEQGIEPRALASVLLEACRVFGPTRHGLPSGLALPFFRQRSVKDRIQTLMEESTMSRERLRPTRRVYALLAAGITTCAVFVAGFRIHAQGPPSTAAPSTNAESAPAEAQPASPAAAATPAPSVDLSGIIAEDQVKNLQAGLPIEVQGFGKFPLETLVTLAYCDMAEAPRGRLVDIQGKPLTPTGKVPVTALVTSLSHELDCIHWAGRSVFADGQARFLVTGNPAAEQPHDSVPLRVRLSGGQTFETLAKLVMGKVVDVHIPTHLNPHVSAPQDVAKDEIAGVVVDEQGQPLAGVDVDLYDGMDVVKNKIRGVTDQQGQFLLKGIQEYLSDDGTTVIRFRKAGYSPERFLHQPVGVKGWVVALAGRTYLEGVVKGPDGKPAAGALIRGHQGPKEVDGGILPDLWTETTSDADGRYRLYLQPDEYELHVKAPGAGGARLPKQTVFYRDQRTVDIDLKAGVKFEAVVVDSITNQPVPNVRLWNWQHPGIEGRSDAQGKLTIAEMLPGEFEFDVEASGYARWWSSEAKSESARLEIDPQGKQFQRNFDSLDYDLKLGMPPVKIVVERAVKVTGRVVDPDGQPVAGATVAPAKTGTGNSLTGDTRFSVESGADGTFTMWLPASNGFKYNLIVHDGKYQEWRRWANGVLPPFKTKPGDELKDVEMRLTRPAVVRGKVVDQQGQPLANFEVVADPFHKVENRYYLPTTMSKADGTFELNFVRPGQHVLQAISKRDERVEDGIPVTMSRRTAPSKPLMLKAGQTVNDVVLAIEPQKDLNAVNEIEIFGTPVAVDKFVDDTSP